MLEVHARFAWDSVGAPLDSTRVGVFIHEAVGGQLVNRGTGREWGQGEVTFRGTLAVAFGPLQVAIEGLAPARNVAAQERRRLALERAEGLAVSDLLLAEEGEAPAAEFA